MKLFAMLAKKPLYSARGPSLLLMMRRSVAMIDGSAFWLTAPFSFAWPWSAWMRVLTLHVSDRFHAAAHSRIERVYDRIGKDACDEWASTALHAPPSAPASAFSKGVSGSDDILRKVWADADE